MPDYPSNISRAQFALIQPDLENFRKHTRPRRYDLYDVFNAIANFPGFYNSMSKKPTITAFFEV